MGLFSDVLLTVDYDRTLTAPDSTVPERNIEAIRYFIENGGAFTINTGRSVPMTKVFRDKVPVNAPLLLYNGSAAYDLAEKKLTFCHAIHMDLWETEEKMLRRRLRKFGFESIKTCEKTEGNLSVYQKDLSGQKEQQ